MTYNAQQQGACAMTYNPDTVRWYVWDEEGNQEDGMELVSASDYDAVRAERDAIDADHAKLLRKYRELEADNERLLSLVCQWSESCTGRHGSQMQCVETPFAEGGSQSGKIV